MSCPMQYLQLPGRSSFILLLPDVTVDKNEANLLSKPTDDGKPLDCSHRHNCHAHHVFRTEYKAPDVGPINRCAMIRDDKKWARLPRQDIQRLTAALDMEEHPDAVEDAYVQEGASHGSTLEEGCNELEDLPS